MNEELLTPDQRAVLGRLREGAALSDACRAERVDVDVAARWCRLDAPWRSILFDAGLEDLVLDPLQIPAGRPITDIRRPRTRRPAGSRR